MRCTLAGATAIRPECLLTMCCVRCAVVNCVSKGERSMFKRVSVGLAFLIGCALLGEAKPSNSAIAAFNQGAKLFNENKCGEAMSHFDTAISADPDFADAYYARAACRQRAQDYERALIDIN